MTLFSVKKTTRITQIALAPAPVWHRIFLYYVTQRHVRLPTAVCSATSPHDDSAVASRRLPASRWRRRSCFTEDYGAATFVVGVLLVVVSIGRCWVPGQMHVLQDDCPLHVPASGPDTRPHISGYHRSVSVYNMVDVILNWKCRSKLPMFKWV